MSHFAKVENSIVTQVIVAEQAIIDSGMFGNPSLWIQTSYNTHGGVHTLGGTPLRMNFAGLGFKYDKYRDAFIPPQPYLSWRLNNSTCLWEAPIPYPTDNKLYKWDERTVSWVEI